MTKTEERAISEVMQIYGYLSPDKQQALDVLIQAIEDLDKMQNVLDEIRAKIERKAYSGQWSDATIYGMLKAVAIIDKYRGEL